MGLRSQESTPVCVLVSKASGRQLLWLVLWMTRLLNSGVMWIRVVGAGCAGCVVLQGPCGTMLWNVRIPPVHCGAAGVAGVCEPLLDVLPSWRELPQGGGGGGSLGLLSFLLDPIQPAGCFCRCQCAGKLRYNVSALLSRPAKT